MTDIDTAKALRIAAERLRNGSNLTMPTLSYDWLVAEADRLDRAAADDREIEEAARLSFDGPYRKNSVMDLMEWECQSEQVKTRWIAQVRFLRDHFRKAEHG